MKTRVDAGTDVAMIGAWDASRNDAVLADVSIKSLRQTPEEDAVAGNLFLIHTGADGGGPIDVYVEEMAPQDVRKQFRERKREFLLSLPSGRVVVGGVEDYRSGATRITGQDSIVQVPSGNYALRCLMPKGEIEFEQPTRAELEAAIGTGDFHYYRRIQKLALTAYFGVPMLFAILGMILGWKTSLAIAAGLGIFCYGVVRLLSRDERCRRASRIESDLWKAAHQRGLPTFIFELRRVTDTAGLEGGSIRLKN